jgi:hypothetical protein
MGTGRRSGVALLGSAAVVSLLAPMAGAAEIDDLKAQIEALRARLDRAEVWAGKERETVAPANAVTGGDFPGSWKLPGSDTSISFSGYVKSDFIYDLGPDVGDTFAFSSIPVDNSAANNADGNVRLHARQSRFRFDSRTPTDWGMMETRIEVDFLGPGGNERFSNSNALRVRHAYARLGPVLVGQTTTTFQDQDTDANTIDFNGPANAASVRQGQIRYTQPLADGLSMDVAVENPEMTNRTLNTAATAAVSNTGIVDRLPDLVGAVGYRDSWGVVNISGVGRQFNFDNGVDQDSAWGYGIHVGAHLNLFDGDRIGAATNFGKGIGRYATGALEGAALSCATGSSSATSGASPLSRPGCGANLEPQFAWGFWSTYSRRWTDTLSSNLTYGHQQNEYNVNQLGAVVVAATTNSLDTVHANLIWSPVPTVNFGLEFMHG